MKRSDIVVVVPIYKEQLNITEQVSLGQLYRVLNDYDIVFVAPTCMYDYCTRLQYSAVYFDDNFFKSTATYSELLISDIFYSKFAEYEYMLIYQLDAYVFKDELLEFCKLGYDYIGAPVPRKLGEWGVVKARVGNGGLSLRKISSVRRIIADMEEICEESGFKELFYTNEDLFFGYCGANPNINFSVPNIQIAVKFAVDEDVCHMFKRMNAGLMELPFGCHGWSRKIVYNAWSKFVAKEKEIEIKLDDYFRKMTGPSYREVQWYRLSEYILLRYKKYKFKRLVKLCNRYLAPDNNYVIWGAGEYGIILNNLLVSLGYNIQKIIDIKPQDKQLKGIEVTRPNFAYLSQTDCSIVITPVYYDEDIRHELLVNNISDKRLFTYRKMLNLIISDYVRSAILCNRK